MRLRRAWRIVNDEPIYRPASFTSWRRSQQLLQPLHRCHFCCCFGSSSLGLFVRRIDDDVGADAGCVWTPVGSSRSRLEGADLAPLTECRSAVARVPLARLVAACFARLRRFRHIRRRVDFGDTYCTERLTDNAHAITAFHGRCDPVYYREHWPSGERAVVGNQRPLS